MYCYDCGQKNNEGQTFCEKCGITLSKSCSTCNFVNQPASIFCGGCGKKLFVSNSSSIDAERRQLTVMFCDLVGSSELAEKFDPEELRDLLKAFQETVAKVTVKFEGHIAKYIGDGLLIYFGHPNAHEDDARRSVLAGLGIIEEIQALNIKLQSNLKIELDVRIGIHTGLVVIGQMGSGQTREENAIVGKTPNIAARIESVAKPNTVAISNHTNELTKGLFITKQRDFKDLKGISEAIKIFDVISKSTFLSDFDVRTQKGLTPIVGRTKELDFLKQSWSQAKKGLGQVVWLSGEAGVGKSRIINEFMASIVLNPQNLRLYYCSSVHSSSAFYPIMSHLKRLSNISKDDPDFTQYEQLKSFLESRALQLGDVAPLLAPFLGIKPSETFDNITPEKVKEMIIDSWFGLMVKMADENPLLLVFEDTHWVDPSTQELINLLSQKLSAHRILLLITSRPSYHISAEKNVLLQSLTLNRLDSINSSQMISHLGGKRSFPSDLVDELVVKADGVPLFIEELTKAVMDSNLLTQSDNSYVLSAPLSKLAIPSSLKDSLMARLDRLSETKNIAQIAATIGRTFSIELLDSLSLYSHSEIGAAISKLLKTRLIYKNNDSNTDSYHFSHALLQETAYQSLLKSTRKEYHGLIADSIINSFPDIAESEPEVVALHCTRAGKTELAVSYWLAAGKKANKTSSHNEAIAHLSRGVDLLNTLPDSDQRFILEFQIQVRLIGPLIAAKSYASHDVEEAFTRALYLSKIIDTSHEVFPALHGRYAFYQVCGFVDKARDLVDEFYEIARGQKVAFPNLELIGSRLRASSLFLSGNSSDAIEYFKKSIAAYDYEKHKKLVSLYGQDTKVTALSYLGIAQWHLGKTSETYACAQESINLAKQLSSSNTIGIAYFVGNALPFALLDEPEKVLEACEVLINESRIQEMPLWKITGKLFKGWALVRMGQAEKGMKIFEKGLASYHYMRIGLFRPLVLLLQAQIYWHLNLIVKGIAILEESLELSKAGGEHWLDAETHRMIGELQLAKVEPDRKKAQVRFKTAYNIAQQQSSLTQELRVAMSLLIYAIDDDELIKAELQLSQVYAKFDDRQNFKDLSQARKLLGIT